MLPSILLLSRAKLKIGAKPFFLPQSTPLPPLLTSHGAGIAGIWLPEAMSKFCQVIIFVQVFWNQMPAQGKATCRHSHTELSWICVVHSPRFLICSSTSEVSLRSLRSCSQCGTAIKRSHCFILNRKKQDLGIRCSEIIELAGDRIGSIPTVHILV